MKTSDCIRTPKRWARIHSAALFGLLAVSTARAQTLIDLGDLGGGFSQAAGINDLGQVVGQFDDSRYADEWGQPNAFLYSDGTMTDLGTLSTNLYINQSYAYGINNTGQVVGESTVNIAPNSVYSDAFVYSSGSMTDLGTLGGLSSGARGINNSGQVVGYSDTSSGGTDAFLYSSGTMTNLGTLSNNPAYDLSVASGINNSGQVVGYSQTSSGATNAFLYSSGTMTNLGTLSTNPSYNYSQASGINDSGQVVGDSQTSSGAYHAFLFSNGIMTDLGTLGATDPDSYASAINNSGQVVGVSGTFHFGRPGGDPFFYSASTGMVDLNVLYASLFVSGTGSQEGFVDLEYATGINNLGQITGFGDYWNGTTDETEAFLLDPAAAPEPSTWVLLLGGLGGLAVWPQVRRQKTARASQAQ